MSLLPGRERADFKQERAANDWYWEQSECIRTSFRTVQVEGAIHDPACGSGGTRRWRANLGTKQPAAIWSTAATDFPRRQFPRRQHVARHRDLQSAVAADRGSSSSRARGGCDDRELCRSRFCAGKNRLRRLYTPFPPQWVLPLSARASMHRRLRCAAQRWNSRLCLDWMANRLRGADNADRG